LAQYDVFNIVTAINTIDSDHYRFIPERWFLMSQGADWLPTVGAAERRAFIGGSDARTIMGDDEAALVRLWREKRGEVEPEDLSGNLIVQLGLATEPLNRQWYERNAGQVLTGVQRRVQHPVVRWMAATLDGMVEATGAVF
jgi:predicted phage-related endonuclease